MGSTSAVGTLIQIQPSVDILNGYQEGVYDSLVCAILRGISLGDKFPPVPVIDEFGEYSLCDYRCRDRLGNTVIDGGHHRSFAHYLAQEPLDAIVVDEEHVHRDARTGLVVGAGLRIPEDIMIYEDVGLEKYDSYRELWDEYRLPCRYAGEECPLRKLGYNVCGR